MKKALRIAGWLTASAVLVACAGADRGDAPPSVAVYEGKLHSDDAAGSQSLLTPDGRSLVGAGVRVIEHFGRSQVSLEEIEAIKLRIAAVTGASFRARDG